MTTTSADVTDPVTARYIAPNGTFSVRQLDRLREKSPEMFVCSICGEQLRLPDSIAVCGWCSVEHLGEAEPELSEPLPDYRPRVDSGIRQVSVHLADG